MLRVEQIPESALFGCVVRGLRSADIEDVEVREELRQLWLDKGLIVFRGGDHDPEFQVELSKCFGELQLHTMTEILHPERKELVILSGEAGTGQVMDIDGEQLLGYIPWHQDQKYAAESNHGGILQVVEMPSRGGDTGFLDQITAYDALSDEMKERVEGLDVAYRLHIGDENWRYLPYKTARITRRASFQDALEERIRGGAFPTVVHPLVYTQAGTGRKVLNFSPCFADHVIGLAPDESDALLFELCKHMMDESRAYDHVWEPGDMVLWDNWRMLHCARGIPPGERRIAQRTTIAGDYSLGRVLEEAALA